MAVPKRRMSRANTRSRRAQWKAKRPELVGVTVAGQIVQLAAGERLPHGRQSVTVEARAVADADR